MSLYDVILFLRQVGTIIHELRTALRALRRAPSFSVVAVLTLAIAIGSAAATFSVVDAVLVRGLPYPASNRLETVYEQSDNGGGRLPSYPTVHDWQTQAASVGATIDGFAFVRGGGVLLPGTNGPQSQVAAFVTPGFFSLLGVRPLLGRTFAPDEERLGAPRVCVISYAFFVRQFGADPRIVGTTIPVDSVRTTIIGVMPRGFAYPNFVGGGGWAPPALWQPIAPELALKPALMQRGLHVDSRTILRLHAGADSSRAAAALSTIERRLASEYPADQEHWTTVALRGLSDELFGTLASTLLLISGAIALVLLLACANVTNLLLVRASVRSRELAVRAALGASAWRLSRYLLAEAVVIAAGAGALGLGLAFAIVGLIRPYANQRLPFATAISVDRRAVAFTVAITAATTLLIGVLPALSARRSDLVTRLRSGATAVAGNRTERRARDLLVAVQMAVAITVLIGAGLLVQSVRRLSAVPLGYDETGVISFAVTPPKGRYAAPAQAAALYERIIEAVRAVPSVTLAAAAGGAYLPTKVETEVTRGAATPPTAIYHPISADFLPLLRVPIVEGRGFTLDDMRSPSGFLVTRNLAKQLWPNERAVGQRITVYRASQDRADFGQPITLPVIGVTGDFREFGPESKPAEQVFLPYTLEVWPWMSFAVRSTRPTESLAAVTRAVHDVEPGIDFRVSPNVIGGGGLTGSLTDPRVFVASLMTTFAAVALALAAIGLYGIIAYGVTQRSREIGIRLALGATRLDVLALVLRQATIVVLCGIAAGMIVALGATRILRTMLFDTSTTDVGTMVVVPVVLVAVAILASLVPAIRAAKTDPVAAMRIE